MKWIQTKPCSHIMRKSSMKRRRKGRKKRNKTVWPYMHSHLIQANERKHPKQVTSTIGANNQRPTAAPWHKKELLEKKRKELTNMIVQGFIYGYWNEFSPCFLSLLECLGLVCCCAGLRPNSIPHGFVQEPHNKYLLFMFCFSLVL